MEASETDRDSEPVGLLEGPTVPLRGMGTGVRGLAAGSSRDTDLDSTFVLDDVNVDVVSEYDQLSTDAENVCFPLNGTSGGVDSFFVSDVSAIRSRFLGVEDSGCIPASNSRCGRGELPGDKTSPSKDDAIAEK